MDLDRPAPEGNGAPRLEAVTWTDRVLRFCLEQKLVVALGVVAVTVAGLVVAPFDFDLRSLPRDPVPVDAIPDLGENQQIVFTEWAGRSPQDVEDQVTYPLSVALLGVPRVKTLRSSSMFGFSTLYVIFDEGVDFYWARARLLEKLAALPPQTLPEGLRPALGPDATALGQVFWYTLEGQDEQGQPTGGWDPQELRTIQDWYLRYSLAAVPGVAEVASVGGFVKEYQVDVDPDALRAAGVTLEELIRALRDSNLDVGARTMEFNRVEYVVRGLGFVRSVEDLEETVVRARDGSPLRVGDVAQVRLGPALRRGALDDEGAEAVGGVVVVRHGENPLEVIGRIHQRLQDISAGLPSRVLPDGRTSKLRVVPFYDRSGLILETLGTLKQALSEEILVTILVVLALMLHLRSSLLISSLLPLAVLMAFLAMRGFGVEANVVALSGIAIAIGTMVDMGIVLSENILEHLERAAPEEPLRAVVYRAAREVGSAVLTAVATTVVGFLPVFTMEAAEGKLFKPLALTKTFALVASVIVALTVIPPAAELVFGLRVRGRRLLFVLRAALVLAGAVAGYWLGLWVGLLLSLMGAVSLAQPWLPERGRRWVAPAQSLLVGLLVASWLSESWLPLGAEQGWGPNLLFVLGLVGGLLGVMALMVKGYARILGLVLRHRLAFLGLPGAVVAFGLLIWLGFPALFGWLPTSVKTWAPVSAFAHTFPGLGKEFMPPLDEGSFLFMPTTMAHGSIGEVSDVLSQQDRALARIPEVERAVGKLGRVDSALDPAPVSMIETVVQYRPEFLLDPSGRRRTFAWEPDGQELVRDAEGQPLPAGDGLPYHQRGRFLRDEAGRLVPDDRGKPFRQWRPALDPELDPGRPAFAGVQSPEDIWAAIVAAAELPGTTSAPRLQPIAARQVMLQSGMRAPMGLKVLGPDLATIEALAVELEALLKEVPAIDPATVVADRVVGKPYLEIVLDRPALARYGLSVAAVQRVIEVAIGGMPLGTTVEGRERYPIRLRYARELRDRVEDLERVLVASPGGAQIPLGQLARIEYRRGPQSIRSENTFLLGYVLFDMRPGQAEVDVVEQAQAYLAAQRDSGRLTLPAGTSYHFAGSYENQVRAQQRLRIVLPLALLVIFVLIYLQFRSVPASALVFSGILVAWGGGFLLIWLYGRPWFLDVHVFGVDLRELFQVRPVHLSVAIWVGFLALFGIASDDGVLMTTYLEQRFAEARPVERSEVRALVIEAAQRRVRPALMTTATTLLALLPVLSSRGRGAGVMVPMAIPSFGGMAVELLTLFVVPVLYSFLAELRILWRQRQSVRAATRSLQRAEG